MQGNNSYPRYDFKFLDQEGRFKARYVGNSEGKLRQVEDTVEPRLKRDMLEGTISFNWTPSRRRIPGYVGI